MNSKVIVVGDEAGNVINISPNNSDFGFVKVAQVKRIFDDNSFMKKVTFTALIHGNPEDLKEAGYHVGQELNGNIIVEESLEPFNKKNPAKSIKKAGETNVVCTFGGFPIHRRTKYTEKANAEDILISHDNKAEVKAAYAASEAAKAKTKAMQPNAEFDTEAEGFNL